MAKSNDWLRRTLLKIPRFYGFYETPGLSIMVARMLLLNKGNITTIKAVE
jgi:hypothetical protein